MQLNFNNITKTVRFDIGDMRKEDWHYLLKNIAYKLHWSEQIYFLYQNKQYLNPNPVCSVCGVDNYEAIKSKKGTYYSVQKTDYKGSNFYKSGFFSSTSHYVPESKIESESRQGHKHYHCMNCQTDFDRVNDFDLLLLFNGFDTKNLRITDIKSEIELYEHNRDEANPHSLQSIIEMMNKSKIEMTTRIVELYEVVPAYIKKEIEGRFIRADLLIKD